MLIALIALFSAHGCLAIFLFLQVDLVCDRAILAGTLTSIHFGGALVGAFVLGQLSDIYGRRLITLISVVGTIVTGTGLSFIWNYGLMAVVRFISGVFVQVG